MTKLIDRTNERYGRWVVKEYAGKGKYEHSLWLCLCECGNQRIVEGRHLHHGGSKSCGCYRKEKLKKDRKGVPLPLDSIAGAHTNHMHAKEWHFVNKGRGLTLKGKNLNQLIEDNRELFTEKELAPYKDNARSCLSSMMLSGLHRLKPNGEYISDWKGWTIG